MNILQIANKAIYPPDGGSLAILSLAKGYKKNNCSAYILNMVTKKHSNNPYPNLSGITISGVEVNTEISVFRLLLNYCFSRKPYISKRFISSTFETKLIEVLRSNNFDFVQIEGLYTLQYIHCVRKHFNGNVLYRAHNLEYLIWERNAEETTSFFKKIYFRSLSRRLKNLELSLINSYDYLLPISQSDANIYTALGNQKPVLVSPFGIDIDDFQEKAAKPEKEPVQTINYIGALDWIPNQSGLLWFITKCFPLILNSYPNTILKIAGRNAPESFKNKIKHKNIEFVGEVTDACDFIRTPGPIIVPLFSGSGMRVKIIESMALKKAIVATSVAAEGIDCQSNKNILIANNEHDFANSVITLLNNFDYQTEIGENAFNFVQANFDYKQIALNILKFIQ